MRKVVFLLILATILLSACSNSIPTLKEYGTPTDVEQIPTTNMDEFAQCLADNDATMYGADWCPHCNDQKKMFGSSFSFVNYVECEENPGACSAVGIRGYPTWIVKDKFLEGGQSFEKLSSLTGCELPTTN